MTNEEREFLESLIEDQTQQLEQFEKTTTEALQALRSRCRMIRQAYRNFLRAQGVDEPSKQADWMTELDCCVLEAMHDHNAISPESAMSRRDIAAAAGASPTNNRMMKRLTEHKLVIVTDKGSYLSKKGVIAAENLT